MSGITLRSNDLLLKSQDGSLSLSDNHQISNTTSQAFRDLKTSFDSVKSELRLNTVSTVNGVISEVISKVTSFWNSWVSPISEVDFLLQKLEEHDQLAIDTIEGNVLVEYYHDRDFYQFGLVNALGKLLFVSSKDKHELDEIVKKHLKKIIEKPRYIDENQIKNSWGNNLEKFKEFKKALADQGLLSWDDDSITFLDDQKKSTLVSYYGPDKEKKMDLYLRWTYEYGPVANDSDNAVVQKKEPNTFERKVLKWFKGAAVLTSIAIISYKAAQERFRSLNAFYNGQNEFCSVGGLVTSGLCVLHSDHKEACIGVLALSCIRGASGEIVVKNPIPDQIAYANMPFALNIDLNSVFQQTNPNLTLDITLNANNGSVLPNGMKFSATPQMEGLLGNFTSRAIYVEDNKAYLAGFNQGLGIVDVLDSKKPIILGGINSSQTGEVFVLKNQAYVSDSKGLEIYDVSNPRNSIFLNSIFTHANDAYVLAGKAYVADGDFKVYDVSDYNNVKLLGSIVSHGTQKIFILDNIAYVTAIDVGLDIIDISDPTNLKRLGILTGARNTNGIFVVGKKAYLTDFNQGLLILDVTDPAKPVILATYSANTYQTYVSGNKAYLINKNNFEIVDISDVFHLVSLGSADIKNGNDLQVLAGKAYISDDVDGLAVVDIYKWCLSGIPTCSDSFKRYNMTLKVKNDLGETAVNAFSLTTQNKGPYVIHTLSDQKIHIGNPFDYKVPADTFFDDCSNKLTYSSTLAGGDPLPLWLKFDPSEQRFSGIPQDESDIKNLKITVKAEDAFGSSEANFGLNVVKDGIKINGSIPEQRTTARDPFEYTFASNLFIDEDGDDLAYYATSADGKPLPSWLTFDSSTKTFSGTPKIKDLGKTQVRLFAKDLYSEVFIDFTILVTEYIHYPPVINKGISNKKSKVGDELSFAIPDDAFSDPENFKLTYNAFLKDKKPLPDWLKFIVETCSFSGVPKNTGILEITVSATDPFDQEVETTFTLTIEDKKKTAEKAAQAGIAVAALSTAIIGFVNRGNIRNWMKRKRYQIEIRENFAHKIERINAGDIGNFKVLRAISGKGLSVSEKILSLFKDSWEEVELEESELENYLENKLPDWLEYDEFSNQLKTVPGKMKHDHIGEYRIRIFDKHRQAQEEFFLEVQSPSIPEFPFNYETFTEETVLIPRFKDNGTDFAKILSYEDEIV